MLDDLLDWLRQNSAVLPTTLLASVALLIAAYIAVPRVLARMPADYFAHRQRPARTRPNGGRARRIAILIGRNVLGYLCLAAGLAMLMLPGPGLAVLLAGLLLVDFPGKYRAEQWIISRKPVLGAANWIRRRRGRAPFKVA